MRGVLAVAPADEDCSLPSALNIGSETRYARLARRDRIGRRARPFVEVTMLQVRSPTIPTITLAESSTFAITIQVIRMPPLADVCDPYPKIRRVSCTSLAAHAGRPMGLPDRSAGASPVLVMLPPCSP